VFRLDHVRVREGRRQVVITIVEEAPNGPLTQAAKCINHLVRLSRPVGGRAVIDGATGKRRPQQAGP
jgi:hypothetical protein